MIHKISCRATHLHGRALGRDARESDDVAEEDCHVVEHFGADFLRQLQLQRHRLRQHLIEQRVGLLLLSAQLLRLIRQADGVFLYAVCHAVDEERNGRSPDEYKGQHDDVDGERKAGVRQRPVDTERHRVELLPGNVGDDVSDGDGCRHPGKARVRSRIAVNGNDAAAHGGDCFQ